MLRNEAYYQTTALLQQNLFKRTDNLIFFPVSVLRVRYARKWKGEAMRNFIEKLHAFDYAIC